MGDPDDSVEFQLEGVLCEVSEDPESRPQNVLQNILAWGWAAFPRAEMFAAGNAIGKQAMIYSQDWTTTGRQQTPLTWRLKPRQCQTDTDGPQRWGPRDGSPV